MEGKLTSSETELIEGFLDSINKIKVSSTVYKVYSAILLLLGLVFFIYAVIITLKDITDRVVYLIFLPGVLGGIVCILLGTYIFKYSKRLDEKKRLAEVIKKLMD